MAKEQLFDITVMRPWPDIDVHKLVDKRVEDIIAACGATSHEIYLTGPGNYRMNVATIKPYKGTRVGLEKPHHWETVSRRLKDYWGAITVNGIEADDWLGVRGTEEGDNYTAASRDKDIRQIGECLHYSWACGVTQPEIPPYKVDGLGFVDAQWKMVGQKKPQKQWKLVGYGTAFLYGQLLTGDSVDNIPGCRGVGPSAIPDLFRECQTEEDYFKACVYQYHRVYGDSWRKYLTENFNLLYLIRDRSSLDIERVGNELNCKVNKLWEIPYDTSGYFFGAGD